MYVSHTYLHRHFHSDANERTRSRAAYPPGGATGKKSPRTRREWVAMAELRRPLSPLALLARLDSITQTMREEVACAIRDML